MVGPRIKSPGLKVDRAPPLVAVCALPIYFFSRFDRTALWIVDCADASRVGGTGLARLP